MRRGICVRLPWLGVDAERDNRQHHSWATQDTRRGEEHSKTLPRAYDALRDSASLRTNHGALVAILRPGPVAGPEKTPMRFAMGAGYRRIDQRSTNEDGSGPARGLGKWICDVWCSFTSYCPSADAPLSVVSDATYLSITAFTRQLCALAPPLLRLTAWARPRCCALRRKKRAHDQGGRTASWPFSFSHRRNAQLT